MLAPWKNSYDKPRQCIKKQRHHLADKGPHSQSYGSSSSHVQMGFPNSSVSKESACNAGDPSSIPGSGRSPGEGIGYPLQYSWASLVAQLVKMRETWVWFLGWEDHLEKAKATVHSSIPAWRIPWTSPWGCKESDMTEHLSLSLSCRDVSWTIKKAEHWRIDALNCGAGEESWESLGLQDQTSES